MQLVIILCLVSPNASYDSIVKVLTPTTQAPRASLNAIFTNNTSPIHYSLHPTVIMSPHTRSQTRSQTKGEQPGDKRKRSDEGPRPATPTDSSPEAPIASPGKKRKTSASPPETTNQGKKPKTEAPKEPFNPAACQFGRYNATSFRRGQIIHIPTHAPNLDASLRLIADKDLLKLTPIGGVYSKNRMAVVIYKFARHMQVLPLYSWGDTGILSQPAWVHNEYVEIYSTEVKKYKKEANNNHKPIGAVMNSGRGLTQKGAVHLTRPISVDYSGNIQIIGQLTTKDQQALFRKVQFLLGDTWRLDTGTQYP